jgi:uncharacterized protein (TIGR03437 family)
MFKTFLLSLLSIPLTFAAVVNYTYDAAGRLAKIDYGPAGSITYTYDKAGNLLSRTVQGSGGSSGTISSVNIVGSPASAGIVQNAWVEIRGTNLVPADTPAAGVIWSTAPEFAQGKMPTQIGSVSAIVNGRSAFIYYYCSSVTSTICKQDQVNILTPLDNTTGSVPIIVTSAGTPSAPYSATVKATVPSFFLFTAAGYVAATHASGSLLGPTSLYPGASTPATPNEAVVVYAAGFALPSTPITNGSASQSGSLSPIPVCTLGTSNMPVAFAGLISPGLYQLNLTVPGDARSGDRPISCTYNGTSTQSGALLSVQ